MLKASPALMTEGRARHSVNMTADDVGVGVGVAMGAGEAVGAGVDTTEVVVAPVVDGFPQSQSSLQAVAHNDVRTAIEIM